MNNNFNERLNISSSAANIDRIRSFTLSRFGVVGSIVIIVSLLIERFQDYIASLDYKQLQWDISEDSSNKI